MENIAETYFTKLTVLYVQPYKMVLKNLDRMLFKLHIVKVFVTSCTTPALLHGGKAQERAYLLSMNLHNNFARGFSTTT